MCAWAVLIAFCDGRWRRVPNALLVPVAGFGLVFQGINGHGVLGANLLTAGLGLVAGLALFLPGYLLRAAGAGDVKFSALAGFLLGLPAELVALLVCAGLLLGLALVWRVRRMTGKSASERLPAAIAISGGFVAAVLYSVPG